jgi:hypothetical protein
MTQATATATITYRRTKAGDWVAFGPAGYLTGRGDVTVTKRDGTTEHRWIDRTGRPFQVNGVEMVYAYLAPRAASASNTGTAREMCAECGERRAVTTARDMSGIVGPVCGRCARSGHLSFA